ncbi:MAG: hypothetical protein JEZ03_11645 [Bacteroidales bacterium]|nr:hypothetical protein [Bacteroidales bacterium]
MWKIRLSTLLGALLITVFLCLLWTGLTGLYKPIPQLQGAPTAEITLLPFITFSPIPTTKPDPGNLEMKNETEWEFYLGSVVQISGTNGAGLNVRSIPGKGNEINFLALDAEVFNIIDGPTEFEEYIWWKLEAPYDSTRTGWAVQDYLSLVTRQ